MEIWLTLEGKKLIYEEKNSLAPSMIDAYVYYYEYYFRISQLKIGKSLKK